jgi:hypothetical protein
METDMDDVHQPGRVDDLCDDPVVAAALEADGTSIDRLAWEHASTSASTGVADRAHHAGACVMDLRAHRDENAAWYATVHFGDAISYHAQRGRRSATVRRGLPETIASDLVGRTADLVADAPGFDRLTILDVRTSPGTPTTLILSANG